MFASTAEIAKTFNAENAAPEENMEATHEAVHKQVN